MKFTDSVYETSFSTSQKKLLHYEDQTAMLNRGETATHSSIFCFEWKSNTSSFSYEQCKWRR